ncbi:type II toxin-antitoxin system HicA family toxin [Aquimarina sp. ERC-38]
MKCSELYRILTKDGWYAISQKDSHVKMRHKTKNNTTIFPIMVVRKWVRV